MSPLRVFISHASADTPFAERLAGDLRRAGADVWLDATHLAGTGGDFLARISRALSNRDVLVLVLSPNAIASKWVPDEMHVAILQYKDGSMQAPLVVTAATVSSQDIPGLWKIYNRIDATKNYEAALKLVLKSLNLELPVVQTYDTVPSLAESPFTESPVVAPPTAMAHAPFEITPASPRPSSIPRSTSNVPAPRLSPTTVVRPISQRAQSPAATPRRSLRLGQALAALTLVVAIIIVIARYNVGASSSTTPGSVRWKFETGGAVTSSPAVANGVVYVGSGDHYLYALNGANGSVRWSYQTDSAVGSPTVADGTVYVGSANEHTYALETSNGSVRWTVPIGDGVASSSLTVASGVVYVGSHDHNVYALAALNGAVRWQVQTGDVVQTPLVVADGLVYVGSLDGTVYAIDAVRGSVKWKTPTSGFVDVAAVANGFVYIDSANACGNAFEPTHGCIYALDASNGSVRWKFQPAGTWQYAASAVANGVLYVNSEAGYVYALDASTGSARWTVQPGGGFTSSPVVANGVVYVGSHDGNVYALNGANGSVRWSYQTGGHIGWTPAVGNGMVYVGTSEHFVYAINA